MGLRLRRQLSADWTVSFLVENGKDRIGEFLIHLGRTRPELHRRVIRSLKRMADLGPPRIPSKFRAEGNGIFALKEDQARLYGFFYGRKFVVLSHSAIKKKDKADADLLRDAVRIKAEFERLAASAPGLELMEEDEDAEA